MIILRHLKTPPILTFDMFVLCSITNRVYVFAILCIKLHRTLSL